VITLAAADPEEVDVADAAAIACWQIAAS